MRVPEGWPSCASVRRLRHRAGLARYLGFTLLETLIALVLLSVMMTLLFSGLRLGAQGWDAAQRRVEHGTEAAFAVRFVQRQVGMARFVKLFEPAAGENPLAFRGHPDRVHFVATLPSHVGGGGLHWVSLYHGHTPDGSGLLMSSRLFHPDSFDGVDREDREAHLLLPDVTALRFRYFGQRRDDRAPAWSGVWNEEQLPEVVLLEFETGTDGIPDFVAAPIRQRAEQVPRFFWPGEVR